MAGHPVIIPLRGDVLRSAWPWVEAQLARRPIAYTAAEVLVMAESGHVQLIAGIDGERPVFLLVLVKLSDGTGEIAYASAHDMKRYITPALAAVDQWCRQNGIESVAVDGRQGWRRVLKKHGYTSEAGSWVARKRIRP